MPTIAHFTRPVLLHTVDIHLTIDNLQFSGYPFLEDDHARDGKNVLEKKF